MISRYGGEAGRFNQTLKILAQKGKFNRILEDKLAEEQGHYIKDVNVAVNDGQFFMASNTLTGDGRVRYWQELIEQIKLFDFKKLSLKKLRKDDRSFRNSDQFQRRNDNNRGFTQQRHHSFHFNNMRGARRNSNWHYDRCY